MLANTTTELEQLKLQRQELQMKLQQAEATIQASAKVDESWLQLILPMSKCLLQSCLCCIK